MQILAAAEEAAKKGEEAASDMAHTSALEESEAAALPEEMDPAASWEDINMEEDLLS